MSQRPRRKKRRTGGQTRPKRGVMIGMRSGFQKAANKVVGAGEEKPGKRSSWIVPTQKRPCGSALPSLKRSLRAS